MKIEWNKKYTTIAAYVLIVVLISTVIVAVVMNLGYIKQGIGNILRLLTPVIAGFCIAYLLNPILRFYETKILPKLDGKSRMSPKMRRAVGLLLVYASTAIVVFVLVRIVAPQVIYSITSIASQFSYYMDNIQRLLNHASDTIGAYNIDAGILERVYEFINQFEPALYSMLTGLMPRLVSFTVSLTSAVMNGVLGLIISIYALYSKETFFAQTKKLLHSLLPERYVTFLIKLSRTSNETFSSFITGKLLDSTIVGILCFAGVSFLKMPYPMLISVIVGITNMIPYFGPIIGAVPCILLILMVDPVKALWFLIFVFILQQFDGNILGPSIIGESIGLTPFWVIFSITLFGGLFGFWGMFIGVPLFSVIYTLIREFMQWRLESKRLPLPTEEYASPEHPILRGSGGDKKSGGFGSFVRKLTGKKK